MQFFRTENTNTHQCFFSGLTREQVMSLNLEEINKTYKKGEVVFNEGNFPNALYVVYKGVVKVHKYGDNGKEQITRLAQPGDLLGYRALIGNDSYKSTGTATEETRLFKIPSTSFFGLLKDSPDFSLKIMQLLSRDLQKAELKVINMAQKSVREKIAEVLLLLNEQFGLDNQTFAINSRLTRKEIGDIAGVTTESTIRTISDFNKENIIEIDGKKIIIHNIDLLKREVQNKIA